MLTVASDCRRHFFASFNFLRMRLAVLALGAAVACLGYETSSAETAAIARSAQPPVTKTKPPPSPNRPNDKKWGKLEGDAVWYRVPADSLAKRRAGKDELTAAHNRLPLGTLVRVTHLANGKSVIVRITDRGITSRRVLIDLCKEAAEQLGMISQGSARVRLEVLPDDKGTNADPRPKSAAVQP
jgi:hypothetical protein